MTQPAAGPPPKIRWRDLLERVFWTTVSSALAAVPAAAVLNVATWKMAAAAGMTGAVSALIIVARYRLSVLPNPGEGLPALPVDVEHP